MTHYIVKTANELRTPSLPANARGKDVQALPKDHVASTTPRNHGLVRSAHENAIYLDAMWTALRGYTDMFALLLLMAGGSIAAWALPFFVMVFGELPKRDAGPFLWLCFILLAIGNLALVLFCFVMSIRGFRRSLFAPKDIPLVFNRQTRKVYQFIPNVPEVELSWAGVVANFKPWPMLLIEYDWDCLEAEYFESTVLIGNVVRTQRVLQLYTRESPGSNTVVGSFVPGSPLLVGREVAMDVWEFIRRYMQEGGPVMYPGDQPAPAHPTNIIQSAQLLAPYYWLPLLGAFIWSVDTYWTYGLRIPRGVFYKFLVFTSAMCGAGMFSAITFNWLTFRFCGQNVTLPPELLANAGARLDLKQLAAQANTG